MDLQFKAEGVHFNSRSAGICIKNGKILLSRLVTDDFFTFVGGKVNFGETTEQAVMREFEEETGAVVCTERLLGIIENIFTMNGEKWHQYLFYYLINDKYNTLPIFDGEKQIKDNSAGIYKWYNIRDIDNVSIKPACSYDIVQNLQNHQIRHIVVKE